MANRKTTNPLALMGYETYNTLMSEIRTNKATIVSSVQFKNDILESQKRINYQTKFDRLQGAKRIIGLQPHVK